MVIEVDVSNKIASLVNKSIVGVCGNSDYVIHFNFDDEWAAYETKTARFKYNGQYADVIFTGTDCPMPIVQNTYGVEIGVYAGDLHTTTSAYLPMKKSILCGSGSPADPEPDVYNQLMDKLNNLDVKGYEELSGEMGNLDNLKTDAKDNLVEAINETATVPDYDQNDETAPDYIKNRPCYDMREYITAFVSELGNIEADGFYKLPNFTIDGITYIDVSLSYDGGSFTERYEISGIQDLSEEFGLDANSVLQVGLYNEENDWELYVYYFISPEAITASEFPATDGAGWYVEEYEGDTDVKLTGIRVNGELKTIDEKYMNGFTNNDAQVFVYKVDDPAGYVPTPRYRVKIEALTDEQINETTGYIYGQIYVNDEMHLLDCRIPKNDVKAAVEIKRLNITITTTDGDISVGEKRTYDITEKYPLSYLSEEDNIYSLVANVKNTKSTIVDLNTVLVKGMYYYNSGKTRHFLGTSTDINSGRLYAVRIEHTQATSSTANSAKLVIKRLI